MSTKGISLLELQQLVAETLLPSRGEIPACYVAVISSTVHKRYLEWCSTACEMTAQSGVSREQGRKIRNRHYAKVSRNTQKARLEELENRVISLATKNAELRAHLGQLQAACIAECETGLGYDPMDSCVITDSDGQIITFLAPERAAIETK